MIFIAFNVSCAFDERSIFANYLSFFAIDAIYVYFSFEIKELRLSHNHR